MTISGAWVRMGNEAQKVRKRSGYSADSRGGIRTRALLAGATLIVLGAMVVVLISGYQRSQRINRRKALQISEYGLLQSLTRLQEEPGWRTGIDRTAHLGGWYKVSMSLDEEGEAPVLTVRSVGHSGPSSRSQACVLVLSVEEGDSVWIQESLKQE